MGWASFRADLNISRRNPPFGHLARWFFMLSQAPRGYSVLVSIIRYPAKTKKRLRTRRPAEPCGCPCDSETGEPINKTPPLAAASLRGARRQRCRDSEKNGLGYFACCAPKILRKYPTERWCRRKPFRAWKVRDKRTNHSQRRQLSWPKRKHESRNSPAICSRA